MNIPEILVANGTGIILVVFLFLLRVRNSETKQTGAVLYDGMLAVTLVALVTETISFLIDGQPFRGCHTLVVLTNTLCTGSTVLVGFLWCLFVDFRIYRSTRRLHRKILALGIPPRTDSPRHQPVRHRAHLPRLGRKCLLSRPAEFSPLCHAVLLLCREYLSSHPLQTDRHYH